MEIPQCCFYIFVVEHKVTQIIPSVVLFLSGIYNSLACLLHSLSFCYILLEQCGQVRVCTSNNNDAFVGYELNQVRSAPEA